MRRTLAEIRNVPLFPLLPLVPLLFAGGLLTLELITLARLRRLNRAVDALLVRSPVVG
jgi:hypothetical protein